jgi:hypothetical protein
MIAVSSRWPVNARASTLTLGTRAIAFTPWYLRYPLYVVLESVPMPRESTCIGRPPRQQWHLLASAST